MKEPVDSLAHAAMGEDQIGNGDAVVIIHISRKRAQSAIGHADGNRRHVLERIRHGEQKDVHKASLYDQGRNAQGENRLRATAG